MTLDWLDLESYEVSPAIFSNFEELVKAVESGVKELREKKLNFTLEIDQNFHRREFAFVLAQTDDKYVRWWEFAIKMDDIKNDPSPLTLPLTQKQFHNLRQRILEIR